jgi:hypothetical protein
LRDHASRARDHRRRIEVIGELRQVVTELLDQRWSPQQISRHLRVKFAEQAGMWLCHESIYQAVYQPRSGLLWPSRLAPHHRSPLRTGRDHRRAQQRTEQRRPRSQQPMLTIHQRPFQPEDRSQPGQLPPNRTVVSIQLPSTSDRGHDRTDGDCGDRKVPEAGRAVPIGAAELDHDHVLNDHMDSTKRRRTPQHNHQAQDAATAKARAEMLEHARSAY